MGSGNVSAIGKDLLQEKEHTCGVCFESGCQRIYRSKEMRGASWHRPRGLGPVEPRLLVEDVGCPSTSSWWAMETPLTLARRGSAKRPSGRHGGGGGAIGGEIVQQPPSHVFLTPPGLRGTRSQECGRS